MNCNSPQRRPNVKSQWLTLTLLSVEFNADNVDESFDSPNKFVDLIGVVGGSGGGGGGGGSKLGITTSELIPKFSGDVADNVELDV
ncbi:hypothetical protein DERP_010740 [Dermatophagoides pteronyssinus]|uniref:Uncharacterized protein n=1 Tax=Dermatophagoides pteronyssinus TaxID=6956 RepID=A0ABQ8J6L8_DERPT|nr:hypothetical protein DERP_010740 [Dermatophagoides pteronyssinus]